MERYTDRTKLAATKDYCEGHLGLKQVARRHGVNVASLRLWAAAYRIHGAAGVKAKQRKYYTAEFKLAVLRRMQDDNLSHRQVAALFNIRNRDMIALWEQAYSGGGIAALSPHSSVRRIAMAKQADPGGGDPDDEKRNREELLEELRQLRMENAYLKKLKALAQAAQHTARDKKPKS